MRRRWRAVVYAVDGTEQGEIGRAWTRAGIDRLERRYRRIGASMFGGVLAPSGIPEPIPGKPMYTIEIERVS